MKLSDITSKEFEKKRTGVDIVVIPVGSLEAHGKHLPLGTDIFAPRLICERIEKEMGESVFVAPEIPYGQSDALSVYPGTVTVPSEVMAEYVYFVGKSFYNQGLKKIVLINGHGGNVVALRLAAEKLSRAGAAVVLVNWWMDFMEDILKITKTRGHAGEDETSAMMYYNESLVDMGELYVNNHQSRYRVFFKDSGYVNLKYAVTGDPREASREKGQAIFEMLDEKMKDLIAFMQSEEYLVNDE